MNSKKALVLLTALAVTSTLVASDAKLQDPTKPPSFAIPKSGKKAVTHLKLSEIRIADSERQAVINGKRLKKGNSIAGYRLKKIEVGYVILANGKGTLRLDLVSKRIIRKQL